MGIRDRWIASLNRVATGVKATRNLLTPLGLLIFGVFTSLFVLAAIAIDRLLDLPHLLPADAGLVSGILVIVVGVAVTAWSAGSFLKARGTPVPFNPPPVLVAGGPYRVVRNPMVTGVTLILLGIGLAIRSVSLVVVFTPLYLMLNVWELAQIEEPELIRRFGDTYLIYRDHTPMFIPGLKRGTNTDP